MRNYSLTLDAQSDLIEIRQSVYKHWGIDQCQNYQSEFQQALRLLAETPALGKSRPDVAKEALSFPCGNHVIYYLMLDEQIIVFGVVHKSFVPTPHHRDQSSISK